MDFKLNRIIIVVATLFCTQTLSFANQGIPTSSTIADLKSKVMNTIPLAEGEHDLYYVPEVIKGVEDEADSVNFKLSKRLQCVLSINLLAAEKEKSNPSPALFHATLIEDIQCLNGTRKNVLDAVDRTQTIAGRMYLTSLLSQGCTDAQTLQKRQDIIKHLYANPEIHEKIRQHLSIIQKNEESLYSWWGAHPRTETDLHDKIIKINLPLPIRDENNSGIIKIALPYSWTSNNTFRFAATSMYRGGALNFDRAFLLASLYRFYKKRDGFRAMPLDERVMTVGGVAAVQGILSLIFHWERKTIWDLQQIMLSREKALARIIESTTAITSIISEFAISGELTSMNNDMDHDFSNELANLKEYLRSKTFAEDAHLGYFSHHGNISKVYLLMDEAKNKLSNTLRYIAMLDAYSSAATLLHEAENNPILVNKDHPEDGVVTYSFAKIINDAATPRVVAKNFFNPVIDRTIVRPSTISFGEPGKNRCGIITGPNAGGKSVNLKGLLINLMLAQSLTIAAAENFEFTPFEIIETHLKSVDDIAENTSKFMSEAKAVANMLKTVRQLPANKFAFLVTDELFTGTEITPAIKLSHQACLAFGNMPNCIYLLATHYKELANLENATNGLYKNFCVHVGKDAVTGKLVYPFNIFEGIGGTNVAFDIFLEQLEKQGIDDPDLVQIIKNARDFKI